MKMDLDAKICVTMSCGVPRAYIETSQGICDPGSKMAQNAPPYLRRWAETLNIVIGENLDRFGEEYREAEGDRATASQVARGVPFEHLR